ncbi:hypothetical protein OSB04_un001873 [Centaurea solstitialis]|uniref:Maturase n=1 Tax=Centaurea solstitialis TaxID=347529 RepID=A0AA38W1D3_9ASTR|nr:hypothetical protein OSB04_un001873 [Centaurea solstitialis]
MKKEKRGRSLDRSQKDHERGDQNGTPNPFTIPSFQTHRTSARSRLPLALRRIKEEWGTSRGFLEFDIRKCFHTTTDIDSSPSLRERIGDPKFFYPIQKVFSAGPTRRAEKGPLLRPTQCITIGPTRQHLPTQARSGDRRIQQSTKFPIGQVVLMTKKTLEKKQASTLPKTTEPSLWEGKEHPTQRGLSFPLFRRGKTLPQAPPGSGGTRKGLSFPPLRRPLPPSFKKPSSLLCAAFLIEAAGLTPKAEFYGRERYTLKSIAKKGLLIELAGGDTSYQVREGLARFVYARYADDLTTGNRGCRRASHRNKKTYRPLFPQSGPEPLGRLCRINNNSCTEYDRNSSPPPRTTPIQFLRELEKRLRVKHRIHINCLPPTLRHPFQVKEPRSPNLAYLGDRKAHPGPRIKGKPFLCCIAQVGENFPMGNFPTGSSHRAINSGILSLYTPPGSEGGGEGGGDGGKFKSKGKFPPTNRGPIKKILRRLGDRGLITRKKGTGPNPPGAPACELSEGKSKIWVRAFRDKPSSYTGPATTFTKSERLSTP